MDITEDALINFFKVSCILCIVLILISNAALMYVLLRKPKFYRSVRRMTSLSLTAGDLAMAPFPLAVVAVDMFLEDIEVPCGLLMASNTYTHYMIHFVYGLGLVMLCLEISFRHFLQERSHNSVLALAASALPWALGIIIILPLRMPNVDLQKCISHQSYETVYTLSVILPASIALISAIAVNCRRHDPDPLTACTSQEEILIDSQPTSPDSVTVRPLDKMKRAPIFSISQNMIHPTPHKGALKGGEGAVLHPRGFDRYPSLNFLIVVHHYLHQGNDRKQHITDQNDLILEQCPARYPARPHQPPCIQQYNTRQPHHLHGNNINTTKRVSKRLQDHRSLLNISVLYFLMVIPRAAVMPGANLIQYPDEATDIAVNAFVFWLAIARSFLTPLVMLIHYLKSEKADGLRFHDSSIQS